MIQITTQPFTDMVIIQNKDDLSNQALCLTPAEAAALQKQLANYDIVRRHCEQTNRAAAMLKHLTIYNLHNLPTIDRDKFDAASVGTLVDHTPFDFQFIKRIKLQDGVVDVSSGVV